MKRAYFGGLGGLALGLGIMYLWDPARGRQRRALLRDKLVRAIHEAEYGARRAAADLRHRLVGLGDQRRAIEVEEAGTAPGRRATVSNGQARPGIADRWPLP